MTSPAFDLQVPATEIEIAEAIKVSDPDVADTIRRLAFQRDRLVTEIQRLQAENDDYRKWYDGEGSKSPETLLAKSRADCVKLRAALDLSEEYNQQKDGELI